MLQVFQLFQTYVANVSSGCYKSRSSATHVAKRVKSERGASGPHARSGGTGLRGRAECRCGQGRGMQAHGGEGVCR